MLWRTDVVREECEICGFRFEFECSANQEYRRGICDHCLKVGQDRIAKEDLSESPPRVQVDKSLPNIKTDSIVTFWNQHKCPLSLGLGFFGALNGRGVVKIPDCSDVFLVECVLDHLRTIVSQSVDIPKDKFVAVHAFTLGDQVPSLDLVDKVVMVIRNEECCVMRVDSN
jgi:hypothetical protein